jgi:diacylglycerol kinase (ATP)
MPPLPAPPVPREATDAQKSRRGLTRLRHAFGYSLAGLVAGWKHHPAFQSEAVLAVVLLPAAFWVGRGWVEIGMLTGAVILVMIVELLNTGIESAIDRIGPEWHALAKQAKDMGSAAVLLSLLFCGGLWAAALFHRFA